MTTPRHTYRVWFRFDDEDVTEERAVLVTAADDAAAKTEARRIIHDRFGEYPVLKSAENLDR